MSDGRPSANDNDSRNDALRFDAHSVVAAWAASGGFASVHDGRASTEAIVEDLLDYLYASGWLIVPKAWLGPTVGP